MHVQVVNTLFQKRDELDILAASLRAAGWQNVMQRVVGAPQCLQAPLPKQRPGAPHSITRPRKSSRNSRGASVACTEPQWKPRANVIVSAIRAGAVTPEGRHVGQADWADEHSTNAVAVAQS